MGVCWSQTVARVKHSDCAAKQYCSSHDAVATIKCLCRQLEKPAIGETL
jgi:hypothetical protein